MHEIPSPWPGRPDFGEAEKAEALWLVRRALREDLPAGDRTTESLFGRGRVGGESARLEAAFVARAAGVLCGRPVLEILYREAGGEVQLGGGAADGDALRPGEPFLTASGPAAAVLRLERTALNFLQRLSGVASTTRRHAEALGGTRARLLDTRKTTPGWRALEKYAVRAGGGENHRSSLSEAVLLKDNHAAVLRALGRGGLRQWAAALRDAVPGAFLEVEVEGREDFLEALGAEVDAILLDNFPTEEILWAVRERDARRPGKPLLEASGGLRLERLREVAATGVDRISVGALTHSAAALDIGLDFVKASGG
ncbi:MAG: carboxylating nicotinate-nucleotide diphosphorylase [Planctomycetes bacterium]|nr:carboxylating nicotinate-nucleotide diphosphorylase [Planctomycetota bacterium]